MNAGQETRPRVLIAEDDQSFAAVLKFVLSSSYETTLVTDGESAWRTLLEQPVDLLITDYQMPVLNGVELCRRIRSRSEFRDLPIIVITAKGFEIAFDELDATVKPSLVFIKPFSPRKLLAALKSLVGNRTGEPAIAS